MLATEKMSVNERRKYMKLVAPRYLKAGRKEQGELLTEMEEVTELHRKSLIRLMGLPSLERAIRIKSLSTYADIACPKE